jgi:hypothetical protein
LISTAPPDDPFHGAAFGLNGRRHRQCRPRDRVKGNGSEPKRLHALLLSTLAEQRLRARRVSAAAAGIRPTALGKIVLTFVPVAGTACANGIELVEHSK